ncbi:MAG: uroporphyrinogen decarboxylase family protein [Desulfobacterales bacterium]|nr:uroporphyrinogen decarboxylase family protein [Desulfobacterales bacterium]
MTPRERVLLAMDHQPTDQVARGEIFIDDELVKIFLKCDRVNFKKRREFISRLGLDAVCLQAGFKRKPRENRLPAPADVHWPDMDRWQADTDLFVFVLLDGPMGWGIRLLGFERFMIQISRGGAEIIDFVHAVEQLNIELADTACRKGGKGIIIADDIAYQNGLLVSPSQLRAFFFPSYGRQIKSMSAMQMPVFFHSDGNIRQVLDDIVTAGFTGLQGLESAAGMDMASVRRRYGKRLCLWGNLDPACLAVPRDTRNVEDQVRRIISVAPRGDGLIFGTSSGLYQGMIPENLKRVYGPKLLNRV